MIALTPDREMPPVQLKLLVLAPQLPDVDWLWSALSAVHVEPPSVLYASLALVAPVPEERQIAEIPEMFSA